MSDNRESRADGDKRQRMRVSDSERQAVVEILKTAMDDGRLKMDEYVERMEKAYEAVTIGDLELLHDDLPTSAPAPAQVAPVGIPGPVPGAAPVPPPPPVAPSAPAAQPVYLVPTPPAVPPTPHPGVRGAFVDLPGGLKVLWTILFAAVSINIVIWVLVGVTTVSFPYPWPLWVAGPAGAALFGISAPVLQSRRAKWEKQRRQLPPS
ncbi:DUF1707 SHOCT-like domain-containing protein [Catenulispora pinisilvae]|uniref:DUF1707 SHOCT-like domain-containing protein n=1 Tax=Catenulispora pinisilvae TaxID=2705253 RepID=UPI001891FE9D|nr:DUF1707 domain-containing protein [Catenulispora pinisilvae]